MNLKTFSSSNRNCFLHIFDYEWENILASDALCYAIGETFPLHRHLILSLRYWIELESWKMINSGRRRKLNKNQASRAVNDADLFPDHMIREISDCDAIVGGSINSNGLWFKPRTKAKSEHEAIAYFMANLWTLFMSLRKFMSRQRRPETLAKAWTSFVSRVERH